MSHPALTGRPTPLRVPAHWRQAVRAELVVLREAHALRWGWLILVMAFSGISVSGSASDAPFRDVRLLVPFMFFFPLAWQREGGNPRRNAPLPMADLMLELIRLTCGATCAALLLGLCISVYTTVLELSPAPDTLGGFPVWYPAALFLTGMANYLIGAAVMLRTERSGRVLLATSVAGLLLLGFLGIEMETARHAVIYNPDGSETWIGTTSLTIGGAALHLALGVAAVCLSVVIGHRRASPRWTLLRNRRRTLASLAGAARTPLPTAVRTKASIGRIAVRQFTLLAPRMVWPLLVATLLAWRMWSHEAQAVGVPAFVTGNDAFEGLWLVAFLWPMLVWMDERRAHPWDEAHPAGTLEWRLVHAAAGFAWLLVPVMALLVACVGGAMSSGTLTSPAQVPARFWIGLPAAMLMLYSLGTAATVVTGRPVLMGILSATLVLPVLVIIDLLLTGFQLHNVPQSLSPTRLLVPVNWHGPEPGNWSPLSALLWTPVFAAVAVFAIRRRVNRDLHRTAPPPVAAAPRTATA